jgi:hypothetical protein
MLGETSEFQERLAVKSTQLFPLVALLQGIYYAATGIWSLVSPGTFQKVTGPKTDIWLVKTVGVLVTVIGGVLAMAGLRRQTTREVPLLGIGSAAGLAAIDVIYASRGRISPIYLADAAANAAIIAAWLFVRRRGRSVPLVMEVLRRGDATDKSAADAQRTATEAAGARSRAAQGQEAMGV